VGTRAGSLHWLSGLLLACVSAFLVGLVHDSDITRADITVGVMRREVTLHVFAELLFWS